MQLDPASHSGKEMYQFLISAIVPRPIAFISTCDAQGAPNLAPFSFFNGVSSRPPMLSVSIGHRRWQGQLVKKDSLRNIEETGDFVVNVVTEALLEKMNQTAAEYPPEVSEFSAVGLTPAPSLRVKAPRVLESPVQLECKLHKVLMLGEPPVNGLVIGEIVYIHADDAVCSAAGDIDPQRLRPVSRLGGTLYATLGDILSLPRPELK